MATFGRDRVKLDATKNRIRLECDKFLDRQKIKSGPVNVGKYRVDVQLTVQQAKSIDPKVQQKIHAEAIKIIGRHSKTVQDCVENLLKVTETQQKKEKKGDKKARTVADKELKKVNSIITKSQNGLGTDLRKGIEAVLKREGVKGKAAAMARNSFAKLSFPHDTFQEDAEESLDESSVKSWQRISKGGPVGVTDQHIQIRRVVGYRVEASKTLQKLLGPRGSINDVKAAQKCLKMDYDTAGDILALIDILGRESKGMSKQLVRDKKAMDARMARQFAKELQHLNAAQAQLSKTLEDGRKTGGALMDILDLPDGKGELSRQQRQISTYARGSDQVKAWAIKSGRPAKTLERLIKTVAQKKKRRR